MLFASAFTKLQAMKTNRVVIKLGTNAITNEDATLNQALLQTLSKQIADITRDSDVLIITSGAVAAGRSLISDKKYDDVTNKQIYAAVGQAQLMKLYTNLFYEHEKVIAQVLATKADFINRTHYLNMKNCLETLFKENIIPILNENDVVATEELMFTDNDELAGLISKMLNPNFLIILSNVDGVYDADGNVIPEFGHDEEMPKSIAEGSKSSFGRGGMHSKFKIAIETAQNGTQVYIANSKEPNVISRILAGENVGTRFLARK